MRVVGFQVLLLFTSFADGDSVFLQRLIILTLRFYRETLFLAEVDADMTSSQPNPIKRNFFRMFTDRPEWRRRTIDDHHTILSKRKVPPPVSRSRMSTLPAGVSLAQYYDDYSDSFSGKWSVIQFEYLR